MKPLLAVATLVVGSVFGGAAYVESGQYDIGADSPHWPAVYQLLQELRERSVAVHAKGLVVPSLSDPAKVQMGAAHYAEMCTGCHLAPGLAESEIRAGLYPVPPKLAELAPGDPARQFWVIKHGVKSTAMPAWGATHDDEAIWAMVAFLQKLPTMTPQQYSSLTVSDEGHEHHHDEESHGHD